MTVREHHSTKALLALSRSESNKRLAQRIQIIAWAQKGMTCPDIVQISNHSRRSIQAWVAAYNADGIEGLRDKPRPGRNPLLAHNKQMQLCRRIHHSPELNPVENLWHYLRSHYWANRIYADYDALRISAVMPGSKFALNLLCYVRFAIAHTLSAVIYYKWY